MLAETVDVVRGQNGGYLDKLVIEKESTIVDTCVETVKVRVNKTDT